MVLDTVATNHMTGAKSAFSELDSGIRGTVKFGNGSVVEIEGHGTLFYAFYFSSNNLMEKKGFP